MGKENNGDWEKGQEFLVDITYSFYIRDSV
jgi:hypothetical protein